MSPLVLQSLLFVGNDRRRTDRSRTRRRFQAGLEFLEDRITPTSVTGLSPSPSFLLIFRQILNPFGVKALCKAKCYPNS